MLLILDRSYVKMPGNVVQAEKPKRSKEKPNTMDPPGMNRNGYYR